MGLGKDSQHFLLLLLWPSENLMKAPDDNLVLKKERKPQKAPHAELHIGFQVSVWVSRIPMKPILRPQFPRP